MLALAVIMLGVAAIDDLRRRRVDNRWWIPFLGAALLANISWGWQYGIGGAFGIRLAMAVVVCGLFYLMWRMRLFGGADAKGLMVTALMVPVPPSEPSTTFALDALSNGLAFSMAVPAAYTVANLFAGRFAFPAMALGVPCSLERAMKGRYWPLQTVDDDGVRWAVRRRDHDSEDPWAGFRERGIDSVWVTPMVPFMVPLTVGAIVAVSRGNLLVRLVQLLGGVP